MVSYFSNLPGPIRHRIVFWLINIAMVWALAIFALRG